MAPGETCTLCISGCYYTIRGEPQEEVYEPVTQVVSLCTPPVPRGPLGKLGAPPGGGPGGVDGDKRMGSR